MRTVPSSEHPITSWSRGTRPRRPHAFHTVELASGWELPEPNGPPPSVEEWFQAERYYLGPITGPFLELVPGDFNSLTGWIDDFGLDAIIEWGWTWATDNEDPLIAQAWEDLYASMRSYPLPAKVPTKQLEYAWCASFTEEPFAEAQSNLRNILTIIAEAQRDYGDDEAIRVLRDHSDLTHPKHSPQIQVHTFPISTTDSPTPVIGFVETPRTIVDRVWLELYERLETGGLPRFCPTCGDPFIGIRRNQEYCSTACQQASFDERYAMSPYRREYQKMYQRMRRGTISPTDFETWKARVGK